MLFINNDSNDVYFNFALEHYFVTEKQMNEPLLVFLADRANVDGWEVSKYL